MHLIALHLFAWNTSTELKLAFIAMLTLCAFVIWKDRNLQDAIIQEIDTDTAGLVDLRDWQRAKDQVVIVTVSPWYCASSKGYMQPFPGFDYMR